MSLPLLTACAAATLLALALVAGSAELATAHVRAQTAADSAALAAVAASPLAGGGGDACAAAAAAAHANGARLRACEGPDGGWALRAEVAVSVAAPRWLPGVPPLSARAAAVLEPAG